MMRVTQDVLELRRWAEAHGARPCREEATGRIVLAFLEDRSAIAVGWDEFEPAFCAGRCVFVYDDAPGSRRCFVGGIEEAHAFVATSRGGAHP
jgi:hypothetical protein